MNVLVFVDAYLPGFKAGGPIVSVSRIIEQDRSNNFKVVTRNRDLGEDSSYPGIVNRQWYRVGRASVAYQRPGIGDLPWIIRQIRSDPPDVYYLNSLQSPWFSLLPLVGTKTRVLPKRNVIIAPRGEASTGALNLKSRKKSFWRPVIKWLLGSDVTWHVSSSLEQSDVHRWWGSSLPRKHKTVVWPDPSLAPSAQSSTGPEGDLPIIVFASRIDRMKGLLEAIEVLSNVKRPFKFEIYGDISDSSYWHECMEAAKLNLPIGSWEYKGSFWPNESVLIFSNATLFLFPTHGENFGHVVAEALAVGCPVFLSGNTAWTSVIHDGGGVLVTSPEETANRLEIQIELSKMHRQLNRDAALNAYRRWFNTLTKNDFAMLVMEMTTHQRTKENH